MEYGIDCWIETEYIRKRTESFCVEDEFRLREDEFHSQRGDVLEKRIISQNSSEKRGIQLKTKRKPTT